MNFPVMLRSAAIGVSVAIAMSAMQAVAQDSVSDEHLAQARQAVTAIAATDQFDGILPGAAVALKEQLIQKDPNLIDLISKVVDEETLKLAPRRGDLEREAALAYARVFTIEELKAISDFYNSPTGKKLISDGPIATREMLKAGEIWQIGIARDLAEAVGKRLASETEGEDNTLEEQKTE